MKGYFVTGTDTAVGKTTVAVALLQAAARRGLATVGSKPVETGCRRFRGELCGDDGEWLRDAASIELDRQLACPYRFEAPLAPALAAQEEGRKIDLDRLRQQRARLLELAPDLLLVEGAGGLLVPLGEGATIADLAALYALPLVIVARNRLGAINHTWLTVEAARRRGLEVAGVVLSSFDEGERASANAEQIALHAEVPILGHFPPLALRSQIRKLDLGAVAERSLDLDRLF
jgi:dethiobiotin synthetase